MRRGSFAFTKWYIDCLDHEGRLVILYWASLEWRRLRLTWHSATTCAPGEKTRTRSSIVPCAAPTVNDTGVHWQSARLACGAELKSGVRGIAARELAPGVTWTCVAPAARAVIRFGDLTVHGSGYAEVVALRTPPWDIGIDQLRWGRWISNDARHSVVWIAWKGETDKNWVFLNDGACADEVIEADSITAGEKSLTLGAPVVVMDRGLKHTIGKVPALRAIAPRWLVGGREVRRTRTGELREGSRVTRGTAVDEIVEFG